MQHFMRQKEQLFMELISKGLYYMIAKTKLMKSINKLSYSIILTYYWLFCFRDTPDALDRLAKDTQAQIDKREKYSRRRMHDDDADIDYINERNMKFNQKLERFYGKYTKEIKDNLERGTAV